MGIPKMEADPCTGLDGFMEDWRRSAFGQPLSERHEPASLTLVRDLSAAEGVAEDMGITRAGQTDAERAESLALHLFDMLDRERALQTELARKDRVLREVLAAQSPVQKVAEFTFADLATRGPEVLATIRAIEAQGHQPGVAWFKSAGRLAGITIGVRVAA
jgi:hypothetical protein